MYNPRCLKEGLYEPATAKLQQALEAWNAHEIAGDELASATDQQSAGESEDSDDEVDSDEER